MRRVLPWVIRSLSVVALAVALAACGQSAVSSDAAGPAEAPRIVALSRSLADMWVLAGGEPVGVTQDALGLEGVPDDVAVVGTLTTVSTEQVVALEPTLVLASGELPSQKDVIATLKEAGIETLAASVDSFADYDELMARLTSLTGRDDLYQAHVADVAERINDVRTKAEGLPGGSYVAIRVSATKSKVLKRDYFACEIFDDLGLYNLADDDSSLDNLSIEAIMAADPTWIFVIPQGEEDEARQVYESAFASQDAWIQLTAFKEGRIAQLPKELFQIKPNAHWDEAYRYAYDILAKDQG